MSRARSACDDGTLVDSNAGHARLDGQPPETLLSVSCEIGLSLQSEDKVDH